jgi:type-F conjugative transfer system pilin assembly protein TrbC
MEETKLLPALKLMVLAFSLAFSVDAFGFDVSAMKEELERSGVVEEGYFDGVKKTNRGSGRYLFISLSMPSSALVELVKEAKKEGFVPVLRGFKENSYRKTVAAFEELVKKTDYGVSIDPELFKEFDIKAVPAIVVSAPSVICPANTSCPKAPYNKLSGNVSIRYALEEFRKKGEKL